MVVGLEDGEGEGDEDEGTGLYISLPICDSAMSVVFLSQRGE